MKYFIANTLIAFLFLQGCSENCELVSKVVQRIERTEIEKFNCKKGKIDTLINLYSLNESELVIKRIKNELNCSEIQLNEKKEFCLYFINSSFESCALGDISFVYLKTKYNYSEIESNKIKYVKLSEDGYYLKIFLPDY